MPLDDLQGCAEFIERDSPYYAATFVQEMEEAAASLADFPHMGRQVPELEYPWLRELVRGNYRLLYLLEENRVVLLAVLHSRRDVSKFWEERNQ